MERLPQETQGQGVREVRVRKFAIQMLEEMVRVRAADCDLVLCTALGRERSEWAIAFSRAYWLAGRVSLARPPTEVYDRLNLQEVAELLAIRDEEKRASFKRWLEARPQMLAIVTQALQPSK